MVSLKQKRTWIYLLVLVIIVILAVLIFHHPGISVYDGFETTKLSRNWNTTRLEGRSLTFQSDVVRKGKGAVKITVQNGDKVEDKTDKDNSSERDELLESLSLYSVEGTKYEYQFSMFLPGDFPITPTRLVIAQWKQFCLFCPCSAYSPVLAIRYISGKLMITLQTGPKRDTLYCSGHEIRNRWLDFKFQIRFSRQKDGEVKAFMAGKQIVNYKGITSYQDECRVLSDKNKYYFKMGLYRDRMNVPMTIYIDEYSKNQMME
jgi:hypothetical protein